MKIILITLFLISNLSQAYSLTYSGKSELNSDNGKAKSLVITGRAAEEFFNNVLKSEPKQNEFGTQIIKKNKSVMCSYTEQFKEYSCLIFLNDDGEPQVDIFN